MLLPELKSTKDYTFIDKGYNRINKDLTLYSRLTLLMGWIGEEGHKRYHVGGPMVATVASIYEYDPDYIILRNVIASSKDNIARLMASNVSKMIAGQMEPVAVWADVGAFLAAETRKRIDTLGLVDTGTLRESVGWAVMEWDTTLKEGK